jgi:hypothetical protein
MSPGRTRRAQRAAHLIAALVIVAYVYGPLGDTSAGQLLVKVIVVPVLAVSGVAMWQMGRIRRALRARKAAGGTVRR